MRPVRSLLRPVLPKGATRVLLALAGLSAMSAGALAIPTVPRDISSLVTNGPALPGLVPFGREVTLPHSGARTARGASGPVVTRPTTAGSTTALPTSQALFVQVASASSDLTSPGRTGRRSASRARGHFSASSAHPRPTGHPSAPTRPAGPGQPVAPVPPSPGRIDGTTPLPTTSVVLPPGEATGLPLRAFAEVEGAPWLLAELAAENPGWVGSAGRQTGVATHSTPSPPPPPRESVTEPAPTRPAPTRPAPTRPAPLPRPSAPDRAAVPTPGGPSGPVTSHPEAIPRATAPSHPIEALCRPGSPPSGSPSGTHPAPTIGSPGGSSPGGISGSSPNGSLPDPTTPEGGVATPG
jgi:hypothetical protein